MTFAPVRRFSVVLPCIAAMCSTLSVAPSKAQNVPIAMTASAETFAFEPRTIVAHVGVPVSIALKSEAGVHGIASSDLGIETTVVRPNHPVTVTFTPKAAGDYAVHCAFVCGVGHGAMAFAVHVEP